MTPEQQLAREAIRAVQARYAVAIDTANYDMLGSCFADDGTLTVEGGAPLSGREAIVAAISGSGWTSRHAARRDIFQRHCLSTCHIEFEDNAARATTYYQVLTELGPDHSGRYIDRFVGQGGKWLIGERLATLDWMLSTSRFSRLLR